MSEREQFEAWISALPYERDTGRFGDEDAWPGQYRETPVQLAWEAWQAGAKAPRERSKGLAPTRGPGAVQIGRQDVCGCQRCYDERTDGMGLMERGLRSGFRFACELCGNKRCPHHANHLYRCTQSNEPGQVGVLISEAPPQ